MRLGSPYLLLTLTALLWSLNWVIGKAVVGSISPLTLTFIRWVIAVAAMMPFAYPLIRAHWPVVRSHWKAIAWIGFWGTGLHNAFAYVGLHYTTATNGVILNSSIPILIIITGWLVYRDTISRLQTLGVAVSLCGVLAVLTRGDLSVLSCCRRSQRFGLLYRGSGTRSLVCPRRQFSWPSITVTRGITCNTCSRDDHPRNWRDNSRPSITLPRHACRAVH